MKKRIVLIIVCFTLIIGFMLTNETISAKATKNTLYGIGKVLVDGSPIHGANGLMFDKHDVLHIASVFGREIVVMDPESGNILDRLGPDVGVEGPDDLTFGPEGSPFEDYLYWTSILTGEVGSLSPDGVKTGQFVAPGVNPITFTDVFPFRLFTALDFFGTGFYELDPNLLNPPSILNGSIVNLNGFDFGPDGYLYGPIFATAVFRIDVDETPPVTPVPVAGGFSPGAVKFDSQGRLHAIDTITGDVFRIDTVTGNKELIATIEPGLDNLAFDSHDRLFVSNYINGTIYHVLPSGIVRTVSRGGMMAPGGIAVLGGNRKHESVFVADYWSLREFNGQTGKAISHKRSSFGILDSFLDPNTVSTFNENLVLAATFGGQVQIWNPDTRLVEKTGMFALPRNAIQYQNDIAVAEVGTGSVVQWDPETDARVTLATGLFVPAGLAAIGKDLWVGDWATGIVWKIMDNGIPAMIPTAAGLIYPEGLAVDKDGSLLVVESGAGRLSRINPQTGSVSIVVDGLELGSEGIPGYQPVWIFSGVAVGPSGYIYVTGDIANCLYRFKPTR